MNREFIANGTYGNVFKIKEGNEEFAIKDFKDNFIKSLPEIDFYSKIKSPFFIPCISIDFDKMTIKMDLMSGNLQVPPPKKVTKIKIKNQFYILQSDNMFFGWLSFDENLSQDEMVKCKLDIFEKMIFQLSMGLQILMNNGYYHLDIKPQNLLYRYNHCKIRNVDDIDFYVSDFGILCPISDFKSEYTHSCFAGTAKYLPPEAFNNNIIPELGYHDNFSNCVSEKSCIWSLGFSLIEIFLGQRYNFAFSVKSHSEQLTELKEFFYNWKETDESDIYLLKPSSLRKNIKYQLMACNEKIKKLLTVEKAEKLSRIISQMWKMISINPKSRPSLSEIISDNVMLSLAKYDTFSEKCNISPKRIKKCFTFFFEMMKDALYHDFNLRNDVITLVWNLTMRLYERKYYIDVLVFRACIVIAKEFYYGKGYIPKLRHLIVDIIKALNGKIYVNKIFVNVPCTFICEIFSYLKSNDENDHLTFIKMYNNDFKKYQKLSFSSIDKHILNDDFRKFFI